MIGKRTNPSLIGEMDFERCPECGETKLIRDHDSAEIVCMQCGHVVSMRIADRGPEWRAFTIEQRKKRTRTGAPFTYAIHDKGLSTTIDWRDRDVYGKRIKPDQRAQIYRLRKWQRRIRVSDAMQRNLAFALTEIMKIANSLSLPRNTVETASVIYRKAAKERLVRGRSIHGISAASVYIACRQSGIARTLGEVAKASKVGRREIGRCFRYLVKELGCFIPPVRANQYVSKFSNQLTMQGKTEQIANEILVIARELRLTSGRGPTGIAAAACYISSVLVGETRTQREIAEIAKVTEVTIRNRYKELVDNMTFLMEL